jgi:hypothetical protein
MNPLESAVDVGSSLPGMRGDGPAARKALLPSGSGQAIAAHSLA